MNRPKFAATVLMLGGALEASAQDLCTGGPEANWMERSAVVRILNVAGYFGKNTPGIEYSCMDAGIIRRGERPEVHMEPVTGGTVPEKAL